jgi:hypothetical protein
MDQGFLGAFDRALDGLQLLSDFQAWSVSFDHFDDGLKVAVGALEPSDNGGMILMGHVFCCPPVGTTYPPWRIKKVASHRVLDAFGARLGCLNIGG